jgi:vacuolar-type H+-ATPase catalytic subunit A/Vma1
MARSNPNGANGSVPDPRQTLFIANYIDPKSDTFANCLQSGIKAGFTEEYSKTIMAVMPDWLSETLKDAQIINQAEKNLEGFLNKESDDPTDKRIKSDMTKFTLERLNKKKYAAKQEVEQAGEIIVKIETFTKQGDHGSSTTV